MVVRMRDDEDSDEENGIGGSYEVQYNVKRNVGGSARKWKREVMTKRKKTGLLLTNGRGNASAMRTTTTKKMRSGMGNVPQGNHTPMTTKRKSQRRVNLVPLEMSTKVNAPVEEKRKKKSHVDCIEEVSLGVSLTQSGEEGKRQGGGKANSGFALAYSDITYVAAPQPHTSPAAGVNSTRAPPKKTPNGDNAQKHVNDAEGDAGQGGEGTETGRKRNSGLGALLAGLNDGGLGSSPIRGGRGGSGGGQLMGFIETGAQRCASRIRALAMQTDERLERGKMAFTATCTSRSIEAGVVKIGVILDADGAGLDAGAECVLIVPARSTGAADIFTGSRLRVRAPWSKFGNDTLLCAGGVTEL